MAKPKQPKKANRNSQLMIDLNKVVKKSKTSDFAAIGALAALQVVYTSRMYNLCDNQQDED